MILYDLNHFSYRNSTLYRFHSENIVVRSEDEDNLEPLVLDDGSNGETLVMAAYPHMDNQYSANCEGMCRCYVEENDIDSPRKGASMIFSHRFASTVVVAVVGLAVAKFVDEYMDTCYEKAMNSIDARSGATLSCLMENSKCKLDEDEDDEEDVKDSRLFECSGHCLEKRFTMNQFVQLAAQDAVYETECISRTIGPVIVEVTEDESYKFKMKPFHKNYRETEKAKMLQPNYNLVARLKFRKYHLVPFCRSIVATYDYTKADRVIVKKTIHPCCTSHDQKESMITNNYHCTQV